MWIRKDGHYCSCPRMISEIKHTEREILKMSLSIFGKGWMGIGVSNFKKCMWTYVMSPNHRFFTKPINIESTQCENKNIYYSWFSFFVFTIFLNIVYNKVKYSIILICVMLIIQIDEVVTPATFKLKNNWIFYFLGYIPIIYKNDW